MKSQRRAQLRYQLHTLNEKNLALVEEVTIYATRSVSPFKSPLVRFTTFSVLMVTALSLIFISIPAVVQNLMVVWGAYVISLDLLILYRAVKKLSYRRFL